MIPIRSALLILCIAMLPTVLLAQGAEDNETDPSPQEKPVTYPAPPLDEHLSALYLGEAVSNRFSVDRKSVTVESNGEVRYTLVVISAGGVRSAAYEGIRCETRELRRYATLRNGTTWIPSRNLNWSRITESPGHRQHAVLYLNFFCPNGIMVKDLAEALRNFARGGRSPLENPLENY